MQAALYLTATRGLASTEAKICYERAESLCYSLNRPLLLYSTLLSQWRYSFVTEKLTATLQIAERVYSLTQNQDDAALMIGGYSALAATHCYLGDDFEIARQYALRGVEIWRSGRVHTLELVEEMMASPVVCLIYEALSEWYLAESPSSLASIAEAISLAKELNDMSAAETQIETSFCEAIRIARKQKAISVEKLAEASYAKYRRQKARTVGAQGFRLPLC